MNITRIIVEAATTLGLDPAEAADPKAVKRAYRRRVLEHPPDRDPDGFRRVRAAFELLHEPEKHAREKLLLALPFAAPPAWPRPARPAPPGATALALLRLAAARLDASTLDASPEPEREPRGDQREETK